MTEKSEKQDLTTRLERLDARYVYLFFAALLIIPIVVPFGLPILVTSPTRDFYDYVEKNVGKGDRVLIWGTMTTGWWPTEYRPSIVAVSQHLFNRGAKLYYISDGAEDPLLVDTVFGMIDKGPAKYGVDYVSLGYYAGGEVALSAFAKDVYSLVKTDYYGTPVDQLPMMKEVKTAKDFKFVMHVTGSPAEWLLRQYKTPYGIDCGWVGSSGMVGIYMPYYASRQVVGFVCGLRGGAEYETLMKRPGIGLASTDAMSAGHLYFALIMIFANIVYYIGRKERKKQ